MEVGFYKEIIASIKKCKPDKDELASLKIRLCTKHRLKSIPLDIDILLKAEAGDIPKIRGFLLTKPTRTISGVASVAIMTRPYPCPHGKCIMCPGGPSSIFGDVPQSYTGKEPATRRAIRNRYDPYLQVFNRLEQYIVSGHVPGKVELIIMGGTFPSIPKKYKTNFVRLSLKAMNDFSMMFFNGNTLNIAKFKDFFELPGNVNDKRREASLRKKMLVIKKMNVTGNSKYSNSLKEEQERNEESNIRCVGMTIETRPDYALLKHANEMLILGATRVELGIQTIYDKVLERIRRGHTVRDSADATRILKDLGFKVNYHVMPGLPGVSWDEDLAALKEYISNPSFRPDMLKIYPCMVLKGTKLFSEWKSGKFTPITTKSAAELIVEFKKHVPEYLRIMRIQRDIPTYMTESGVDRTNLRQYVKVIMDKKGVKCRCIRCREIGLGSLGKISLKTIGYDASEGKEFFISAESDGRIAGFCRLRLPGQWLRQEITQATALVRELHVLGPSAALGSLGAVQHKGIGRMLLSKAELIAKEHKKDKVVVISGIGARNYYRKLGYDKEGPYMCKKIG